MTLTERLLELAAFWGSLALALTAIWVIAKQENRFGPRQLGSQTRAENTNTTKKGESA